MYKRPLLALALLSAAPLAQAQVRLSAGPQVGYTLSSANYKLGASTTFDNRYRSGFSGGLTAELGIGHLLIRPAVLYAQKGYNQTYSSIAYFGYTGSGSNRTRIDYLTVPLNIGYTQHADGQGFQVFAGAYLGFVLGGRYNTEAERSSPSVPGTTREAYAGPIVRDGDATNGTGIAVRATDVGLQGGIGYRYQNLLAQVEYSMGLKNIEPGSVNVAGSPSYHNRVFQLSLAYLFGPKS